MKQAGRQLPIDSGRPPAGMRHWVLAVLLYLFFAVFLIWPIAHVVGVGFGTGGRGLTLDYILLVLRDPVLVHGLVNAVLIGVVVTGLTLSLSLPLAILMVRYEFPGRGLLSGLLLMPLVLPPFVGAIGMRLVFGRFGPVTQMVGAVGRLFGAHGCDSLGIDWLGRYKLLGIVTIEVLHLYPIMLLNLQAALANVDGDMEAAAANLGAGRWTIFRRITLPLIRPGLFAGATLVLIWSFTELGTPLMFDYYTVTPVQIYQRLTDVADNPLPYALVVVMLAVSAGLYTGGKLVLGRGFEAGTTKGARAGLAKRLRGGRALAAAALPAAVVALAVMPHLAVILTSISVPGAWYKSVLPTALTAGHFRAVLTDELTLPAVARSIQYAGLAMGLALVVGLGVAVLLTRSNLPGRGLLDSLAMLPLAVPGVVMAFGYLALSVQLRGHRGGGRSSAWYMQFLDVQENPLVLLVIAYGARRLPYVVRSLVAGLEQTPRDLELAAANLGAGRMGVMRRITLPLILGNLIAGGLLAFAFAMLEVSDSLVLAQRRQYFPIARAIWELSQRLGDGMYIASALGVWAMVFLALTLLTANQLLGKKIGAMFRV